MMETFHDTRSKLLNLLEIFKGTCEREDRDFKEELDEITGELYS